MKFIMPLLLGLSATSLTACATRSTAPSPHREVIRLACPDLTPLVDGRRDTLVRKIEEVAGIYYECRAAALTQPEP